MEKVVMNAKIRTELGKSKCKHLRKEGLIPAVIYKDGKKALSVQVNNKELWHALHTEAGENAIITMKITGEEKDTKKTVIVQEVQHDPVNSNFLHVDFHEISLKDKLKVKVPVAIKGEAKGVKEEDGILTQEMWEIEVECLPTAIPEHIDVRVDALEIGDAIHIKDLVPPADVKIVEDPEHMVVSVVPPKQEEEAEEEPVEGEEGQAEPEVIKKGKEEDESSEEDESDKNEG